MEFRLECKVPSDSQPVRSPPGEREIERERERVRGGRDPDDG